MPDTVDYGALAGRFDGTGVLAIALVGSQARGDAGPHSDIDLLRLMDDDPAPDPTSHLIDGRLVVVGSVGPEDVEAWFTSPPQATEVILGLRTGRSLRDPAGAFAAVQARARTFVWDDAMQRKADAYASREMVGFIEEVHKGLEGLRRGDVGRLLNCQFGCSWGLSRIIQVQRGVLLAGDNAFFDTVEAAVGPNTPWARLRRTAFGIETERVAPTLAQQVTAGLRLYALTAEMLAPLLDPADAPLIAQTAARIRDVLG